MWIKISWQCVGEGREEGTLQERFLCLLPQGKVKQKTVDISDKLCMHSSVFDDILLCLRSNTSNYKISN